MRYQPSYFQEQRSDLLHAFMRRYPLATLVLVSPHGIDAEHVPVLLEDTGSGTGVLRGHVARANPVWRQVADDTEALVIFHGPGHYVSPGWYPSKARHGRVVPTWNYAVVHARGSLTWCHDRPWLLALVTRLTDTHEAAGPQPWQVDDAPAEFVEGQLEAIVGFEIAITTLTGKWKLSQNRASADADGVIAGLRQQADAGATALADLMSGIRETGVTPSPD